MEAKEEHLGEIEQTSRKRVKQIIKSISREVQSERGNETEQSNGMGRTNEFNQNPSRGDSNAGTNLQLDLFSDSYVPPIKELPSVEQQIENIEVQAEVENTPAFLLLKK